MASQIVSIPGTEIEKMANIKTLLLNALLYISSDTNEIVRDSLNECLKLIVYTNHIDNSKSFKDSNLVKSYIEIPKIISKFIYLYKSISFNVVLKTNLIIDSRFLEIIHDNINLSISEIINYGCKEINIKFTSKDDGVISCLVESNVLQSVFDILYVSRDDYISIDFIDFIYNSSLPIVLIVDDSKSYIKILALKLQKLNIFSYEDRKISSPKCCSNSLGSLYLNNTKYNFIYATNGHLGYELAKIKNPFLIITDVQMPVMSGPEMVEKLINDRVKSPIIITSSNSESIIGDLVTKYQNQVVFIQKDCSNFDFESKLLSILKQ